jgi:hypothetical protein
MRSRGLFAERDSVELPKKQGRRDTACPERGAILVMTAMIMMLMLVVAAFATDVGAWYRQGQEQTRVADLGSLNGIQAYEQVRRAAFEAANSGLGYDEWADFNQASRRIIDFQSLDAAATAVMNLLAQQGHPTTVTVTNPDTAGTYVGNTVGGDHKDPFPGVGITPEESYITFVTDDGWTITVTRTPELTITVTVLDEATQYFSHLVTDAPTVERSSTATLSNCGAICDIPITFNPPFTGFDAAGSGDGYAPLLLGDTEIWAVNHRTAAVTGDIVCMDRVTKAPCGGGGAYNVISRYKTGLVPHDYLHQANGKIYFAARDDFGTTRSEPGPARDLGLACFDTITRAACSTPFVDIWNQDFVLAAGVTSDDDHVAAFGPYYSGGQLWLVAQNGDVACVQLSMVQCTNSPWPAAMAGTVHALADNNTSAPLRLTADVINGKLITGRSSASNASTIAFSCFDLASRTDCWGGAVQSQAGILSTDGAGSSWFVRYDGTGSPMGYCGGYGTTHACASLATGTLSTIPGFNLTTWAGVTEKGRGTMAFNGQRTFFSFPFTSNLTGCWDWTGSGSSCGSISHTEIVEPYDYALVTPNCVVGLGHKSKFFSFNPNSLIACVDTTASAQLSPCTCADGTPKWGKLTLPDDLLSYVSVLSGQVIDRGNGNALIVDVPDLLAVNGEVDLSGVIPSPGQDLWLELDMTVNALGLTNWTTPIVRDLELTVAPTLIG